MRNVLKKSRNAPRPFSLPGDRVYYANQLTRGETEGEKSAGNETRGGGGGGGGVQEIVTWGLIIYHCQEPVINSSFCQLTINFPGSFARRNLTPEHMFGIYMYILCSLLIINLNTCTSLARAPLEALT